MISALVLGVITPVDAAVNPLGGGGGGGGAMKI
jgi:hypothetical protein